MADLRCRPATMTRSRQTSRRDYVVVNQMDIFAEHTAY
jgi:hypothetical protein